MFVCVIESVYCFNLVSFFWFAVNSAGECVCVYLQAVLFSHYAVLLNVRVGKCYYNLLVQEYFREF